MYGWIYVEKDMGGWVGGRTDGWMDGWMDDGWILAV